MEVSSQLSYNVHALLGHADTVMVTAAVTSQDAAPPPATSARGRLFVSLSRRRSPHVTTGVHVDVVIAADVILVCRLGRRIDGRAVELGKALSDDARTTATEAQRRRYVHLVP